MSGLNDLAFLYFCFLLYIAIFHLVCWSIRFITSKGKPKKYRAALLTYIKCVSVYLLVFVPAMFFGVTWIGGPLLLLAGLFPIYYWINIFWPSFKKKRLNYDN